MDIFNRIFRRAESPPADRSDNAEEMPFSAAEESDITLTDYEPRPENLGFYITRAIVYVNSEGIEVIR